MSQDEFFSQVASCLLGENCLYSVNHVLNKMLIGQAGSIGGSTRQEVEAGPGEFWEAGSFLTSPVQVTEEAGCELPS
ncbi:hypothetical protein LEMLEM_LOCUS19710 [Lemmus lemmus]